MPAIRTLTPVRLYSADRVPPWADSVLSAVTSEFVEPIAAGVGDLITVRLYCDSTAPVRAVDLRRIRDGSHHRIPMTSQSNGAWEAVVEVDTTAPLSWHFILQSDSGPYFYNQTGVHSIPPTEDHDFTFLPRNRPEGPVPSWPAGAVFYQIFPDRFAQGDPTVGRITGEYAFDGGAPQVLPWDQPPLEFPHGRCQDFFNGDLEGIRRKLDYLQDMGVTAIYVTPIFAARTTHRYDCIDYFSVDPALGGDEALARLTEEMHHRGMKLVVDVSINHTGSDHPWFHTAQREPQSPESRFYYHNDDGTVALWHGVPTLPQLNYGSEELRRIIWEDTDALVRHWLQPPWKIDGWRFDVANQTARRGADQLGHEVWRNVRRAVKETNPEAWIVGEHWEDDIAYQLGDQWDAAMNYFACGSPLRRWAGELTRFEHDAPHYPPVAAADHGGRSFSGIELAHMVVQHYSRLPGQIQHAQLNVLDTHDIHRFHHHSRAFDWEIYRGIVILQFLLPGAPNIWYGDEVGLGGHAESVEGCRFPMQWDETAWDPHFRALYRSLSHRKANDPVLHNGAFAILAADDAQVVAARISPRRGRALVVVLNKSEHAEIVSFSTVMLAGAHPVISVEEDPVGLDAVECSAAVSHEDTAITVELPPRRSRLLRVEFSHR
ncbi:MAG TPA: glycoside hydrolase family 13 protein [Alkalispirochaeta sp.]|nr:glycoside hydrolase family 13 protein [Alkalispirochaeta sp.]